MNINNLCALCAALALLGPAAGAASYGTRDARRHTATIGRQRILRVFDKAKVLRNPQT